MFGRKSPVRPPVPAPPAPPRRRPPAHQSKIFSEGKTFAERKAKADAMPKPARQLVSLGRTEYVQRQLKGGVDALEVVEVEMFHVAGKPNELYV